MIPFECIVDIILRTESNGSSSILGVSASISFLCIPNSFATHRQRAARHLCPRWHCACARTEDTLYTALSMLGTIYHDDTYFDDSKEKIFSSSQDTWKNLSDVPFVDNMETFYQTRRSLENLISRSPQWKFPISEYY